MKPPEAYSKWNSKLNFLKYSHYPKKVKDLGILMLNTFQYLLKIIIIGVLFNPLIGLFLYPLYYISII